MYILYILYLSTEILNIQDKTLLLSINGIILILLIQIVNKAIRVERRSQCENVNDLIKIACSDVSAHKFLPSSVNIKLKSYINVIVIS